MASHVSVAQVAQSPSNPVLILSDPLCLLLAMVDSSSTFQQDAEMVICRLSGEVVASLNRKDSCSCHIVHHCAMSGAIVGPREGMYTMKI